MVKNLSAMWETRVRSLGPLKDGTATHSSILSWKIPWTEEPGGLQSMGLHRVRHTQRLSTQHTHPPKGKKGIKEERMEAKEKGGKEETEGRREAGREKLN